MNRHCKETLMIQIGKPVMSFISFFEQVGLLLISLKVAWVYGDVLRRAGLDKKNMRVDFKPDGRLLFNFNGCSLTLDEMKLMRDGVLIDLAQYEQDLIRQRDAGIPFMPPPNSIGLRLNAKQEQIFRTNHAAARAIYNHYCDEERPERSNPASSLPADEMAILDHLAIAWNGFLKLEVMHPQHQQEFMHAIHEAQRMVLARAGLRCLVAKDIDDEVVAG